MAVHTALFDLDDTLFDHRHARRAALQATRSELSELSRYSLEQLDRSYERLLRDTHIRVLTRQLAQDKGRFLRMSAFLSEFGIDAPAREIRRLIELRQEVYRRNRRAVPGAAALLRRLRGSGVVIGVVTNNLRSEQEEKLRVTGLETLVDHLVCSEQAGTLKPDPMIFHIALTATGGRPAAAVMVGDRWEDDVIGAARAGIRPVWFHRDSFPKPSRPPAGELRSFRPVARAANVVLGRGRRSG